MAFGVALALLAPAAAEARHHRAKTHAVKKKRSAKLRPAGHRREHERLVDRLGPWTPVRPKSPAVPPPPATLANVGVTAKEFSLELSRPAVAAGPVRFSVRNGGEDPHDLRVRPEGLPTALLSFSTLLSGETDRATTVLSPGTYVLWCSLEGHEALGMHSTLKVE